MSTKEITQIVIELIKHVKHIKIIKCIEDKYQNWKQINDEIQSIDQSAYNNKSVKRKKHFECTIERKSKSHTRFLGYVPENILQDAKDTAQRRLNTYKVLVYDVRHIRSCVMDKNMYAAQNHRDIIERIDFTNLEQLKELGLENATNLKKGFLIKTENCYKIVDLGLNYFCNTIVLCQNKNNDKWNVFGISDKNTDSTGTEREITPDVDAIKYANIYETKYRKKL